MANIQYQAGNGAFAAPSTTFDITSVVAERVGPYINYYSFNTDGTMFVLHTQSVVQPDGTAVPTIVGWDHFNGSTLLQTASVNLPLQPFLDNLNSRNPSSIKAANYFLGGDDTLTGSNVRDNMTALGGNDTLDGQGGNDRMLGGNGNDALQGGNGNDSQNGQGGNDVLNGGAGLDTLTGGAGADTFQFLNATSGIDTISDFAQADDQIAIARAAFAFAGPLTDGTTFIAGAGAAPVNNQATMLYDTATGALSYDADGTGAAAAQQIATLTNHATLSASDFFLF